MPAAFTARPELLGTFGMVASTHWLASSVGMSIAGSFPPSVSAPPSPELPLRAARSFVFTRSRSTSIPIGWTWTIMVITLGASPLRFAS